MATLETGKNWKWYVEVSSTYTLITTQRDGAFTIESNTVDGSYKGSGGWTSVVPTLKSWTGSFSCIYDSTDTAIQTIRAAALAQTKLNFKLIGQTGENYIVAAYVKTSYAFPNDNIVTLDVELIPDGSATWAAS